jgi:hypothetical protein
MNTTMPEVLRPATKSKQERKKRNHHPKVFNNYAVSMTTTES